MRRREFLAATVAASLGLVTAKPVRSTEQPLDELIAERMRAAGTAGMSLCAVRGDDTVLEMAYGSADIERQIPMTPDTIQNIGSISKTITATAAMQLVERGSIGLHDDVNDILPFSVRNPRFPDEPITTYHLLVHTSSLRDGPAYGESYTCGDSPVPLADWIRGYFVEGGAYYDARRNFLPRPPGEVHNYSNVAYGLLGYIVEHVSNQSFSDYCDAHVFEPLGMSDTGWHLKDIDVSKHAIPYEKVEGSPFRESLTVGERNAAGLNPYCRYSFANYPDGGLRTHVRDHAKFMSAYLREGDPILKPTTVASMLQQHEIPRGSSESGHIQGLCWSSSARFQDKRLWGHSGGDPGISTVMVLEPQSRIGAVFFVTGPIDRSFIDIVNRLLAIADAA